MDTSGDEGKGTMKETSESEEGASKAGTPASQNKALLLQLLKENKIDGNLQKKVEESMKKQEDEFKPTVARAQLAEEERKLEKQLDSITTEIAQLKERINDKEE